MLTLYSYPDLFGCADNNPFGLKVWAFLKLCGLAFRHQHILDASKAPRGQLPYLTDGETVMGDSDAIIAYLISRHALRIDVGLTPGQRDTDLLVRRMLDDLYWVMSYSRWQDDRFFPLFLDAILRTHCDVTAESLAQARNSTSSGTTSKVWAARSLRPPTPAGWRNFTCWDVWSRRAASCSVRSRAASMPPSTDSSRTSISTR